MTLSQLITFVDELKRNVFSPAVKTVWVNECEGMIQTDILLLSLADVVQYSWESDQNTQLLVQAPHDKLYRYYLEAMICYEQEEYDRYGNCIEMFNRHRLEYVRFVAERLRPQDGRPAMEVAYLSAYAIAVKHGYVGTEAEWTAMYQGAVDAANAAAEAARGAAQECRELAVGIPGLEVSARDSATNAATSATTAESWAVGGTGARPGEDLDNARYWAGEAHKAAGGGVVSFNGRSGSVLPQAGDYDVDMVTGAAAKVIPSAPGNLATLDAEGNLGDSGKKPGDFAPSGFGLGTNPPFVTDFNLAVVPGWYCGDTGATLNRPDKILYSGYGVVFVYRRNDAIYQDFRFANAAKSVPNSMACRFSEDVGVTWGPWEYVNPPMLLGVEYRTTERYMGKPVYTKAINLGNVVPGTDVSVTHSLGAIYPISIDVRMNQICLPWYPQSNTQWGSYVKVFDHAEIAVHYGSSLSATNTSTALVKYTYAS